MRIPCRMKNRKNNHFQTGDEIFCLVNDRFYQGIITDHAWSSQGLVGIKLNKKVLTSFNGDLTNEGSCNLRSPALLHKWEYEFFKQNPDFMERFFIPQILWSREGKKVLVYTKIKRGDFHIHSWGEKEYYTDSNRIKKLVERQIVSKQFIRAIKRQK